MIFYLAGLQAIPPDLKEAAMIEGANKWYIFWRITFPLLTPTTLFVSVKDTDKAKILPVIRSFSKQGFKILATSGTAQYLIDGGVKTKVINKVSQGSPHCVDALMDDKIDIVINTTETRKSINDSFGIRRTALMKSLPYFLTVSGARAAINSIKELRTPILEYTDLYKRSVGDTSDIVNKEIYSFNDRNDQSLSLRPEGTAGVIRSVIEKKLDQQQSKFWYMGPMFRYERPQKGRYRQFHQAGIEFLGYEEGQSDFELIALVCSIINGLDIKNAKLKINHLGDKDSKKEFSPAMKLIIVKKKAIPHLFLLKDLLLKRHFLKH